MDSKIIVLSLMVMVVFLCGCTQTPKNYPLDAQPNGFPPAPDSGYDESNLPPNYGKVIDQQFAVAECDAMDIIENHDVCYIQKAKETGNISYCINAWEKNDECYSAMAYDKNDSSICQFVKNADPHDMCLLEFSKTNFTLCGTMQLPSFKDTCYADAYGATKDKKYCNFILDVTRKNSCNNAPTTQAEADLQGCNLLSTKEEKELCLAIVAGSNGDISICNGITTVNTKDACFAGVALQTLQKQYCDIITDQTSRDMCYQNLAILKKDPTVCDSIQQIPQIIENCKLQATMATEQN